MPDAERIAELETLIKDLPDHSDIDALQFRVNQLEAENDDYTDKLAECGQEVITLRTENAKLHGEVWTMVFPEVYAAVIQQCEAAGAGKNMDKFFINDIGAAAKLVLKLIYLHLSFVVWLWANEPKGGE